MNETNGRMNSEMETSDIITSDDGFLFARDFVKRDFCEPQIGT
jgi:hypothetical protein